MEDISIEPPNKSAEVVRLRIIEDISTHEKAILSLLDDPGKYNVSPDAPHRVKFLNTEEFTEALRPEVERASYQGGEFKQDKFDSHIKSIEGKRTADGSIVVHNYTWEGGKWVLKTEDELKEIADHEKTHGMLTPTFEPAGYYTRRKTGCKEILLLEERPVKVTGHDLYESQTQKLTLYGAHPDAKSFKELAAKNNPNYGSQLNLSTLCNLLDLTFHDFDGGVKFLASEYFSSDAKFMEKILESTTAQYLGTEIPNELREKIISDSYNPDYIYNTIDFSRQVTNLKKLLIPQNPLEELESTTNEILRKDEPPNEEDLKKLKALTDKLK